MKIKKITITDYRGIRSFEAELPAGADAIISGKNGCGKTTIATAIVDVLAKKDYDLHSDPDIFPDDGRECIPTVRIMFLDDNGNEFEVCKKTKAKKLKPEQITAGIKAPVANSYEVNSVPKNERDFKVALKERGIDSDIVLPLMHPDVFTSQNWKDMRKTLFEMTTSHTEAEIAKATGDVDDVIKMMKKGLTLEEILFQTKATYKLAAEQCEAIPNQIIGAESTKKDIDAKALRAEVKSLEADVRVALSGASAYDGEITELDNAIAEQRSILHALDSEEYEERTLQNKEAYANVVNAQTALSKIENEVWGLKRTIDSKKSMADGLQRKVTEMQERYKTLKAKQCSVTEDDIKKRSGETLDPNASKCRYCGQPLPKSRLDAILADFKKKLDADVAQMRDTLNTFNAHKKQELDALVESGKATCKQRDDILDDVAQLQSKYDKVVVEKVLAEETLATAKDALKDVEVKVAEKYAEKRTAAQTNIDNLLSAKKVAEEKKEEAIRNQTEVVTELQNKIEAANSELEYEKLNREVNRRVKELNADLRKYGQQKADCERIFDMLDRISRKKNEMLSDDINSHFSIVKFDLFQYQKNGNYKECCTPMVKGDDGEWREIGTAANTALSLMGKLDIAEGLQKFYGVNLPIIIDGAERLDNVSLSSIKSDRQLIFLAVANNPLTVSAV